MKRPKTKKDAIFGLGLNILDNIKVGRFILIVKRPIQCTIRMFSDSIINSEEGLSVSTFSLKDRTGILINFSWDISLGFRQEISIEHSPVLSACNFSNIYSGHLTHKLYQQQAISFNFIKLCN